MLQDVCCLFSPNLQVSKSLNAGYRVCFFLIFMDKSMIPVKLYHTCVPRFDFSPSSVIYFVKTIDILSITEPTGHQNKKLSKVKGTVH